MPLKRIPRVSMKSSPRKMIEWTTRLIKWYPVLKRLPYSRSLYIRSIFWIVQSLTGRLFYVIVLRPSEFSMVRGSQLMIFFLYVFLRNKRLMCSAPLDEFQMEC